MCPDTLCPRYRHGCTPSPHPSAASSTPDPLNNTRCVLAALSPCGAAAAATIRTWTHRMVPTHVPATNYAVSRPSAMPPGSGPNSCIPGPAHILRPSLMRPSSPPTRTNVFNTPYSHPQHTGVPATHQCCLYAPRPPTDASRLISTCPTLPRCIPGCPTCPSLPNEKRHWENPLSFHVIALDSPLLPHHPPSNGTWT